MEITDVNTTVVQIPLKKPVYQGDRQLKGRDHMLVEVKTANELVGYGYSFGYGAANVMSVIVNDLLAPQIIGEDVLNTEKLWYKMYNVNSQVGRRGLLIRALSAVDIALWDIKGKVASLPLYKLLGAYKEKLPIYTSGGYYREDEDLDDLKDEMELWADRGYGAVKMRVGLASIDRDLKRISIAREALGKDTELMLDAEGVWDSAHEAIKSIRAFEKNHDLYWIEGPSGLDRVKLHAKVTEAVETPVATGGQSYTKKEFLDWVEAEAIDIWQHDAIVCGGITEWLKIANLADAYDLQVSPHGNWNLHAHLLAAIENGLFVEYFEEERDIKVLDRIIKDPVKPDRDGFLSPKNQPGVGIEFDANKVSEYQIEGSTDIMKG